MDPIETAKYIIDALRSKDMTKGEKLPSTGKRPLDQRRDGYRMYAKEQQATGEPVKSYEEWISSQE